MNVNRFNPKRPTFARHLIAAASFLLATATHLSATTVVTWDDIDLPESGAWPASSTDSSAIVSHGVTLNRTWNHAFDCCPGGWAVSRQADQTTPGLTNAFSAVAESTGGGGYQSTNFVVANSLMRG